MPKARKVGGQIKGGSTNLGKLGQKGTTGRAGTGASKKRLGVSSTLNRNIAKISSTSSSNFRRGAHS